jgi:uncharacterized membrane protein
VTLKPLERPPGGTGRAPRHAVVPVRRPLWSYVAALALIAILVPINRFWVAQVFLVPLLLIIPGVILLRALRIPGRVVSSFPVYIPCASIVMLFVSGLAVDIVAPLAGVAAPLRTGPLLVGLGITCLALLAASINAPPDVAIPWRALSRPAHLAWPLILPLIAAAGALRLNSGHGDGVAVIALSACIALLTATVVFCRRLDKTLLAVILYAAGLSILWSHSLRSDLVNGFDIATEYHDLHQTVLTGIWHFAHPGDAYGAMLSVTVMPAELHALSGVPDLLVLKIVYPAIFAMLPVAIFGLASAVLSRRWAFVGAAFIMGQSAFVEIAGVARQEIALVLFVSVIAAMLDGRIRRRSQWTLLVLLGLSMVLSHYSTTYVAITVIGLVLPLQWAASWFRQIPRVTGAVALLFVTILAGAIIWYGPVTHSAASNLRQLAHTVEAQGPDLLPNRVSGESWLSVYLNGNTEGSMPAARYAELVRTYDAANMPYIVPFPDAGLRQYALRNSPAIPVYGGMSQVLVLVSQLVNVLCAVGALLMVLRRKVSVTTRRIGLVALAAVLLLVVLRISGTLAVEYGQERAQLQALVLLSISLCWTLQGLAGERKRWLRNVLIAVAAACVAVVSVNTTSLLGALVGGGTSDSLANSGEEFQRFYMTAPELASARWLGDAVQPGQLVYADRYAQLPVVAMTGITPIVDVTPLTLSQHAWIYASMSNVIDGRARAVYGEDSVAYVFPADFLDANYDIVYTNGSSEVFYR